MQKIPLKKFFRNHRILRWELRLLILLIIACIIGIFALPAWRDYAAIQKLGAGDYQQQRDAAIAAATRASNRPAMIKRLIASLDTPDKAKFIAIHDILFHFRKFTSKHVQPVWLDRYNLIELEKLLAADKSPQTQPAENRKAAAMSRRTFIYDFIINGDDNRYVRRALELVHVDPLPAVRQAAAALAAELGNDDILKKLLADSDPQVAAEATIAVSVANRTACLNDVIAIFNRSIRASRVEPDLIAACAMALANMQATTPDLKKIASLAIETDDEILREKLSFILPLIADQDITDALAEYFKKCSAAQKCPNAMMLSAGAKMNMPIAAAIARDILIRAIDPKKAAGMMQSHIIAAMQTLDQMGIPCRREIYDFIKTYWQPGRHLMLIPAARLLGEQAVTPNQPAGAPTQEQCLELLRQAATWIRQDRQGNFTNTPKSSAAAAVAAWLISPAHIEFLISSGDNPDMETMKVEYTTAFLVREAVTGEPAFAGDYIAWNIGATHSTEAYALGQWLLPGENERIELNPDVRAAGALLLGFATDSANERASAEARIDRRLNREDFFAKGSCQCALLTLWPGREVLHEQVRNLLWIPDFPRRRVWTALMFAGDRIVLDSLLLNAATNLNDVAESFVVTEMNPVINTLAPSLTTPSAAADESTRLLQMRFMRMQWACGRNSIAYGMPQQ
ncbi:MAG TPA: hypothetical protein PKK48_01255 [Phycisphaerae bacterium]|nr:hypothetical protein [Phycisphaerae bacterium]HPS52001.1 hypothetical protein [Phycisphaerae bacterium]